MNPSLTPHSDLAAEVPYLLNGDEAELGHSLELMLDDLLTLVPCRYATIHLVDANAGTSQLAAGRGWTGMDGTTQNGEPAPTTTPIRSRSHASLGVLTLFHAPGQVLNHDQRCVIEHFAHHIAADVESSHARRKLQVLYAEERMARRRAELASRQKDDFIAGLSHELRQPLSAALPALEVQKRSLSPEGRQRGADILEQQLRQLTRMVEDLSNFSHVARGIVALRRERVDFRLVVQYAVDMTSPRMAEKQQDVTLTMGDTPIWVDLDQSRMIQVISNLLQNATAYSPIRGQVHVAVTETSRNVRCSVADNGCGISSDLLPRIWEPFQRGSRERADRSFGLGLAIVRQLVALHDGTVSAASDGPGRGSTFTVTLPVDRAPASERFDEAGGGSA